jgi:hypothetical protein
MTIITPTIFDVQTQQPIDTRIVKDDIASRNNISTATRYWGLIVHVVDSDGFGLPNTYVLTKGENSQNLDDNLNWKLLGAGGAGSSPLTTKGDLYGYSTADTRISVGSNGQVLTADSTEATGVKWSPNIGGDLNYDHDQVASTTVWTITHNLGKNPSVKVIDSGSNEVEGDISYTNSNELTITFSASISGHAYLN